MTEYTPYTQVDPSEIKCLLFKDKHGYIAARVVVTTTQKGKPLYRRVNYAGRIDGTNYQEHQRIANPTEQQIRWGCERADRETKAAKDRLWKALDYDHQFK